MATNNDIKEGFFQECDDLLEAVSDGFVAMDAGARDKETLNAVFRAVHSIKGGAAAFRLDAVVEFAHGFENVLDALRAGKLQPDFEVMQVFHRSGDRLADLIAAARADETIDPAASRALLSELEALTGEGGASEADATEAAFSFVPLTLDFETAPPPAPEVDAGACGYLIEFAPSRALYATGNDPVLLLRALDALGEVTSELDASRLPPLGQMAWGESYLSWKIRLLTDVPADRVREIFDFVVDACTLEIRDLEVAPNLELALDSDTALSPGVPDQVDGPQIQESAATDATAQPGLRVVSKATMDQQDPSAAEQSQGPAAAAKTTIRVDLDRVDRLINLVGELVINQAMLAQSIAEVNLPPGNSVDASLAQLKQLSSEMQERIMAIRAQPVKPLFQRMARIAREAGQMAGKRIRLVTIGESTEVDKTVIERLADPLTHMIRNAVDHGVESGEKRRAAGKSEEGTVTLSANHRSGSIVIELQDDGAGINRPKVRDLAIEKGLIPADKELTDSEIDNLLFLPGFSTKTEVSSLSGRGVGMDVVRSEIHALGGRVAIGSRPGLGTTVTISLPLTLAVIEGMVVEAKGETLVIPTSALQETLQAEMSKIHQIGSDGHFLAIRGGFVPIVDLAHSLGFNSGPMEIEGRIMLLIESEGGRRTALLVDRIIDQREVVIKGIEANYDRIPGIAAATILGDGRIALIIDTEALTDGVDMEMATRRALAIGAA